MTQPRCVTADHFSFPHAAFQGWPFNFQSVETTKILNVATFKEYSEIYWRSLTPPPPLKSAPKSGGEEWKMKRRGRRRRFRNDCCRAAATVKLMKPDIRQEYRGRSRQSYCRSPCLSPPPLNLRPFRWLSRHTDPIGEAESEGDLAPD